MITLSKNLEDLAIWWQLDNGGRFFGSFQIFQPNLPRVVANSNHPFGVQTNNVSTVNADGRAVDVLARDAFGLLDRHSDGVSHFLDVINNPLAHAAIAG